MSLNGITAASGVALAPERISATVEKQNQLQQEQGQRVDSGAAATAASAKEVLTSAAVRAVPPVSFLPVSDNSEQDNTDETAPRVVQEDGEDDGAARLFLFQQRESVESVSTLTRAREAFSAALKLQERDAPEEESAPVSTATNDNEVRAEEESAPRSVDISA